jgi:histidyl-tRNA synthetase
MPNDHLPGFRDFYPEDCAVRNHLFYNMRQCAWQFNFTEYDTPILEPLELFTKKSGDEIIDQLFSFTDKGGRAVALRPEITPSLVRMVGAKIHTLPKPIKWFSIAECFRYERTQKGRKRSFYQFNADILGEESVAADAEVIALGIHVLETIKFAQDEPLKEISKLTSDDFHVRLSDRQLWTLFLESQDIPKSDWDNILKCIDQSEKKGDDALHDRLRELLLAHSPNDPEKNRHLVDIFANIRHFKTLSTTEAISEFFEKHSIVKPESALIKQRLTSMEQLLSRLKAMGYGDYITLDFSVVRGLAYYTGFVFEFFERHGDLRALAGGGRYDDLATKLGCSKTNIPAVGLAMGDVTLRRFLEDKGMLKGFIEQQSRWFHANIALLSDSSKASKWALEDATRLRQKKYQNGYSKRYNVIYNLIEKQMSIDKQMEQIKEKNTARYVALYGESPDQVEVYDINSNTRYTISRKELVESIDFHAQDPLAPFRHPKPIKNTQDDISALP